MDKQQLIELLRNNRGNFKDIYNFIVNTARKGGGFVGAVGNAANFLGNVPKNVGKIKNKFEEQKRKEAEAEKRKNDRIRALSDAKKQKILEFNKMLDRTEKGLPLNKELKDINKNTNENMGRVLGGLEDYNKSKKFNADDAITQSKVYQNLEKQKQLAKAKADKKGLRDLNKQLAKTKTPLIPYNRKGQTYKDIKNIGDKPNNSYLNLFTPPTTKVPKYNHSEKVAKTPLSQKINSAVEQNKKTSILYAKANPFIVGS